MPLTIKTIIQPKIITSEKIFKKVRTRFAPSPTGYLHIGGIRTALYAYLLAKHFDGKFLLRIEDTDQARFVKGSILDIFNSLKWVNLNPDEYSIFNEKEEYLGDEGKLGPYVQSRRLNIYKKYAQKLVEEDKAYYCFCTAERLEKMRAEQNARKQPTHYDRACRELSKNEIDEKIKSGARSVIRFKTSTTGITEFTDLIRSAMQFNNSLIDDYILQKSDGYPTYHLASVIDDHFMEISHIIRGEEWLPSAPIHIMLYKAFGWVAPYFAHLPNILGDDKKKLSKRTGDVAVNQYIAKGYLPDALLNFILLLGWNPGTEKEIFSREEMIQKFSLEKVGKSGAFFDLKKLDSVNGQYIRKMGMDKLTKLCVLYLVKAGMIEANQELRIKNQEEILNSTLRQAQGDSKKDVMVSLSNHIDQKFKITKTNEIISFDWLKKIIALEQERIKKLSDIAESTKYFFVDIPKYDVTLLKWKKSTLEKAKENLAEIEKKLEILPKKKFKKTDLEIALKPLMEKLGVGDTLWPLRVALSGAKFSPSPFEIAEVLGKEKVLARIKAGIEKIA